MYVLDRAAAGLAWLGRQGARAVAGLVLVGIAVPALGEEIDGVNIVVLFIFVAAIMESVGARFMTAPGATIGLAALAFAVYFSVLGLTAVAFCRAGGARALALGLTASQRNMGLMLAATGGALPDLAWLYFALSQFPIYLAPQLLQPLVRRLRD
ncbi:MAG: hypothetical protein AB9873_11795 [Syntrophobacteraceae bacterium]